MGQTGWNRGIKLSSLQLICYGGESFFCTILEGISATRQPPSPEAWRRQFSLLAKGYELTDGGQKCG